MSFCFHHDVCVANALKRADDICYRRHLRFTRLRRQVFQVVWKSHGPAKAYDILKKLKRKDAPAKPPTVYRALNFLLANGLIHKLNSLNAYVGCSHPLEHQECYFLICRHCQKITECCHPDLVQTITQVANENKFKPGRTMLEIEGTCQDCLKSV